LFYPIKKLSPIYTADIARWVYKALTDTQAWENRAISLAGDELAFSQASTIFKARFGHDVPRTYDILGRATIIWDEVKCMMKSFDEFGCAADIRELRKQNLQLARFKDCLERSDLVKRESRV
jgi:hypothetical protein